MLLELWVKLGSTVKIRKIRHIWGGVWCMCKNFPLIIPLDTPDSVLMVNYYYRIVRETDGSSRTSWNCFNKNILCTVNIADWQCKIRANIYTGKVVCTQTSSMHMLKSPAYSSNIRIVHYQPLLCLCLQQTPPHVHNDYHHTSPYQWDQQLFFLALAHNFKHTHNAH